MGDKLILFDFRCQTCSHKFDELVESSVRQSTCPECGNEARRIISTPRLDPKLGVDTEGFGTMADKWARTREQKARIDAKKRADHGEDF